MTFKPTPILGDITSVTLPFSTYTPIMGEITEVSIPPSMADAFQDDVFGPEFPRVLLRVLRKPKPIPVVRVYTYPDPLFSGVQRRLLSSLLER